MQLEEYAVLNQIEYEPTFAWWIKKVPKKIYSINSRRPEIFGKRHTSTDCASHIWSRKPLRQTKKIGTHYGGITYYRK